LVTTVLAVARAIATVRPSAGDYETPPVAASAVPDSCQQAAIEAAQVAVAAAMSRVDDALTSD
jgi:hypothetical protein